MILSMTTIPSRLPHIEPVIQSLYGQAPLLLSFAMACDRTGDALTMMPGWLERYPDIMLKAIPNDRGSIEKLLQPLELDFSNDIITVDDDVIYPPEFVDTLKSYRSLYPDSCLCFRGKVKDAQHYANCTMYQSHQISEVKRVDIVTGTWGAYYHASWFDLDALYTYLDPQLKTVDDMVISRYLSDHDIPRYCLPLQGIQPYRDVALKDSLWAINRRGPYNDIGMEPI